MVITDKVKQRFDSRIQVDSNGCWIYCGHIRPNGYGQFYIGKVAYSAHRIQWERYFGSIPVSYCVCHKCDVRSCVNPEHLFLGTQQENVNDRERKGRGISGKRCHTAKLTEVQVREIRTLRAAGKTLKSLARQYNVCLSTIARAGNLKSWRSLP
jgi:hypothetical protein